MAYRIGAIFYVLWGVLHLAAAYQGVQLALSEASGEVQGRLMQNSWNLGFFAVVAIVVAIFFNWRNSRAGYWINLATVSAADIGFVLFVLAPGYVPLFPPVLGPVFWVLGALFTTLGLRAPAKA
jgi:4-amino-4-deoxy-L-arabinose transferase-like glycosyltransferase